MLPAEILLPVAVIAPATTTVSNCPEGLIIAVVALTYVALTLPPLTLPARTLPFALILPTADIDPRARIFPIVPPALLPVTTRSLTTLPLRLSVLAFSLLVVTFPPTPDVLILPPSIEPAYTLVASTLPPVTRLPPVILPVVLMMLLPNELIRATTLALPYVPVPVIPVNRLPLPM